MGYSDPRKFLYEVIPNHTTFNGFEIEHDFPNVGEKVFFLNARRDYAEGSPETTDNVGH